MMIIKKKNLYFKDSDMGDNEASILDLLQDKSENISSVLNNVKRLNVHEINKGRQTFGEYHHLFPLLRKYPKKFEEYMRMQVKSFDYILSKIDKSLQKKWCNLHTQPIFPEERLVICLR